MECLVHNLISACSFLIAHYNSDMNELWDVYLRDEAINFVNVACTYGRANRKY